MIPETIQHPPLEATLAAANAAIANIEVPAELGDQTHCWDDEEWKAQEELEMERREAFPEFYTDTDPAAEDAKASAG